LVNINKSLLSYPSLFIVVHLGTYALNGIMLELIANDLMENLLSMNNLAEEWLVEGQDHNWYQKLRIPRQHEQDDDNL
jgi:hypothetical protein